MIFAVLEDWCHHIVLTHSCKLEVCLHINLLFCCQKSKNESGAYTKRYSRICIYSRIRIFTFYLFKANQGPDLQKNLLRAKAECFARLCHHLGVCPSVCPSVCLSHSWIVSKRCKVANLSWQNFLPLGAGVPLERGRQRGVPPKRRHFAVIGSNNVKTVADRYIHAAYLNKHWWQAFWIYQHRWPWTTLKPSKRGFSEFFAIFECSAHFNTELRRNGWR